MCNLAQGMVANTRFFHNTANGYRNKNWIHHVSYKVVTFIDSMEIRMVFTTFFCSQFGSTLLNGFTFDWPSFFSIKMAVDLSTLEATFSESRQQPLTWVQINLSVQMVFRCPFFRNIGILSGIM